MRALVGRRLQSAAFAVSLCVVAILLWPGLAWALPGDTCSDNPAVVNQITICVAPSQRPVAGGCGACIPQPPLFPPSPCLVTSGQNQCCSNLSEAVFIAEPGDTIGVFGPTVEPAVKGATDVGPNVIIAGPYGTPFNSNQVAGADAGLRIEECQNAKIAAGTPSSPVIDIRPGAGQIIINGIDVTSGAVGILAQESGIANRPGVILKGIRAEFNEAVASTNLTQLFNAQLTLNVSSSFAGFPPERAVDDDLDTSWFTADGNACNVGPCPFFEIVFPEDVTVSQLQMFGNREFPDGFDFLAGIFQLKAVDGTPLYNSGVIDLPAPNRDVTLAINPNVANVRSVRFTATANEGPTAGESAPGFAELKVFGFASGAGIEVRGNFNQVSSATAMSNDIGILVSGDDNLIRNNNGNDNDGDGFLITGDRNDIRANEANTNGAIGFDLVGTDNMLRSNQSNRSSPGGPKENGDCEYSFENDTTKDLGGNKKDNANFVGTIPGSPKRYAQGCSE